jgi:probable rRNA maturation factor
MIQNALTLEIEAPGAPEGAGPLMQAVARAVLGLEGLMGVMIAARLVDDEAIRRINRDHRGIDRATDVLSFPSITYPAGKTAGSCLKRVRREYDPSTGLRFLGDLVISLPRALAQAQEYGHCPDRELGYLTAHGVLHLLGYDHATDDGARVMRSLEEQALSMLMLSREGRSS